MMKTFISLALTLVLSTSLLVGCGCTNQNMDTTSAPTVLPTNEEIWDTTEPSTRPTTAPTTESTTHGTEPSQTIDRGNGPLEDYTTDTTESSQESRTRQSTGTNAGNGSRIR